MKAHGSTILVLRMAVRVKVGFRSSGAVPDLFVPDLFRSLPGVRELSPISSDLFLQLSADD